MKPLLVEVLDHILSQEEKLYYVISCDDEELVAFTRDTSLACNQKEGDEYEGVNAVDEARIEIYRWNENSASYYDYIGFIYWTNFNDGVERIVDNSCKLDDEYGLNQITRKWEEDYRYL